MLILESDFRVVRANRAFYHCFKVAQEETLGTILFSLGAGQWDVPALRRALQDLSPLRTRVNDLEVSRIFPVIGCRSMRLNAVHLPWDEHALILLTIQDVTERRKDMDRLRTTDRQKDEFLAMLGHELRNPLAAMSNALNLWQASAQDDKAQRYVMSVFQRQVANQARLVEDLLDVSRITRGVVTLRIKKFDLCGTVSQALAAAQPTIDACRLHVSVTLPPEGLLMEGDPMRLEQVVTNLLGNAVKYTQPGGQITLTLRRDNNDALFTVADNGVGISAEILPSIFDVFVQAETSTDRNLGGLGIGLALVHRLVELHGGTVTAESAGLTLGSTFVIRIPTLPVGPRLAESTETREETVKLSESRRILLVDDNVDALESSTAVLRMYGHTVASADDVPSAIDMFASFLPDVVLLDIGLPGMDGYEVCRRMRLMPDSDETVIVAHSGYGQARDRQRSMDAGFDHHLVKPANLGNVGELTRAGQLPD